MLLVHYVHGHVFPKAFRWRPRHLDQVAAARVKVVTYTTTRASWWLLSIYSRRHFNGVLMRDKFLKERT